MHFPKPQIVTIWRKLWINLPALNYFKSLPLNLSIKGAKLENHFTKKINNYIHFTSQLYIFYNFFQLSYKKMCSSLWIAGLLILGVATNSASGISCGEAITKLIPCEPFLLGWSSSVSVSCCSGAASLNQLVGSDPSQLKGLCVCLKQAATSMGVNAANAKHIPDLCHITTPVPIDPNVNCDR